jgi:hypothetical protein
MYRLACVVLLSLSVAFLLGGCPGPATGNDQIQEPDDNDGGTPGGPVVLSGRLNPGQAAKERPRMQAESEQYPFTIVAQSDQTGAVYRVETDADGTFQLELPEEEAGNSFVVSILSPDGRAVGPVMMGSADEAGVTGLKMDRDADLGTVNLPDDPTRSPIVVGSDGDAGELADPALTARLNDAGVPVGLASVGKGADSQVAQTRSGGAVDADRDGLIDLLDADDDGNGVIDDLDKGDEWTGAPDDIRVNFFMNLKIQVSDAHTYYAGTAEEIAQALSQQTVITFEVMTEPWATRAITAAYLLETPGPTYLPIATLLNSGGSGGAVPWKDIGYAFTAETDRFDAFVVPQAVMNAGDTFTVAVTFDDGSTVQVSRMINYVFKSIPALVQYGTRTALVPFDITDLAANGTPQAPLTFDGAQDLVLVFRPPPDETGAPITGADYCFSIFFNASDGGQLNADIDKAATWPGPVPGWSEYQGYSFEVAAAELGELSEDGTYAVTLPKEIFVDQVVLEDGAREDVVSYKIDIAAELPTGNAALMVMFVKQ